MSDKDAIEEMEKILNTTDAGWDLLKRHYEPVMRLLNVAKAQRAMCERIEEACKDECECGGHPEWKERNYKCAACRVWHLIHTGVES